jgi:NAD(P)-dependent dehydrogenase (short-subunit alcohol dehydrogenase family)
MSGYTCSKAGVIGLVKGIAKEYPTSGVTINGLAPAVVMTDLVRSCAPEQVAYMTAKIPMARCGTIEEVAAISAWIVSRECSFCTGFIFDMSGGRATYWSIFRVTASRGRVQEGRDFSRAANRNRENALDFTMSWAIHEKEK